MNYTDCAIIKGKIEMRELQVDMSTLLHPPPLAVYLEYLKIPNYNLDMYLVKSC